ncbi:Fic family protein [Haloquadratum walsbyi]|uniref:Fic family protein n=1 Tax=Haloquadratum walsbyi TaxID=293091 RepID=UPI0015F4753C|nr:Fic family protein [Haloquadratum walsbyi]
MTTAGEHVREGHFDHVPKSFHRKAFQLLHLIVVNHPFVNGNKRTALMSVRSFCALNGLEFAYNRQIKEVLKTLTTNERRERNRFSYLREHTEPLEPKYKTTIELWLTQIMDAERISDNIGPGTSESQNRNEPNDYDSDSRDSN